MAGTGDIALKMASDDYPTRRKEAARWLRKTVGVVVAKDLPAEPSEEDFLQGLRSGMILCNLVNKLQPGAIPKVVEAPSAVFNEPDAEALSAYYENIRNFLVAVEDLGLPTFDFDDLEEGGDFSKVVDCLLALKSFSDWKKLGGSGSRKFSGSKSSPSAKSFNRRNSEPSMTPLSRTQSVGSDKSFDTLDQSGNASDANEESDSGPLFTIVCDLLEDKEEEDIPIIVENILNKLTEEFENRLVKRIQRVSLVTSHGLSTTETPRTLSEAIKPSNEVNNEKEEATQTTKKEEHGSVEDDKAIKEQERISRERELLAQQEKARKQQEEKERAAREAQERAAREEQERAAREAQERAAREEQERIAREEQERLAREEQERLAREEQERLAREEEEQERLAREEQERLEREEQERIAREEQERLRKQQEEEERAAREEQERIKRHKELLEERERLRKMKKEDRERAKREQQERIKREKELRAQEKAARKEEERMAKEQVRLRREREYQEEQERLRKQEEEEERAAMEQERIMRELESLALQEAAKREEIKAAKEQERKNIEEEILALKEKARKMEEERRAAEEEERIIKEKELLEEEERARRQEEYRRRMDEYNKLHAKTAKSGVLVQQQHTELQELRNTLSTAKIGVQSMQKDYLEEADNLGKQVRSVCQAAAGYKKVLEENRKLYNQVQDLKGNIRVYCRIRPFLPGQENCVTSVDYIDDDTVTVIVPSKSGREGRKASMFTKVFGPSATQEDVFADTQPLIRSVLDGFNVCIFAYGQTGSGKTYTLTGPSDLTPETMGVNYRALKDLFLISEERKDDMSYEISVNMLEIYNDEVRDLLVTDGKIRNGAQKGMNVPDANLVPVTSTDEVVNLMNLSKKNRAVSSTDTHDSGSRSHSFLTVHVFGKDLTTGTKIRGCMHLVDLAGSEKIDDSEDEAAHVSKSLSAFGDVMVALALKSSKVNYKSCKLTQLLQDALGGQAKILVFVHVHPDLDEALETVNTLKFIERFSTVEGGAGKSGEVRELKEQIALLKAALAKKEAGEGQSQELRTSASLQELSTNSPRKGDLEDD
ncbi:kinesin-like protein KIN-14I, partial [Cynara cardunculus var. scolymus]|uniref:kinesin-like protein KIN-14I n=1 Tax=Cynara cardunculus var. scolymus TaxID=59895 RepID=UPI000D62766C